MITRLEVGRNRFGEKPLAAFEVYDPCEMVVRVSTGGDNYAHIRLSRGELAMLRGLLADMDAWERSAIAAGLIRPMIDLDRRGSR